MPAPTTYLAQAFVPDLAPGASIDISDGEQVVWRREAPAEPPHVRGGGAKVDERSGEVWVEWDSSGEAVEHWLRWSADGESWQSVATGLREPRAVVRADDLPGGDGLLQVVAHDGFHSVYSEPFRVRLPERPASLVVLHPVDGYTYVAGSTVRLWASMSGPGTDDEPVWSVDDKDVARGLDTWVTLEAGDHAIGVRPGGREQTAARVRITVEPRQE